MVKKIIPFAHSLLEEHIKPGDIAIDGTCGNGYDTDFIAKLVGETGYVYGFDLQNVAIENTRKRLKENNLENRVELICDSHENIDLYIKEKFINAAIFNLGYLPGGDKTIVTKAFSTIKSIESILPKLAKGGLVILAIYWGHAGGDEEKKAILEFSSMLNQKEYSVLEYKFINQINCPPFLLVIEKC